MFNLLHARYYIWISGIGAIVAIVAVMLSPYSPFRQIQPLVFDLYQRLHPRPYGNSPVVIVDIDEESIARIGQWPWPRTTMATLTDRLGELGAATVVFDIVFSEPGRTSPARVLGEFSDDIETLLQHYALRREINVAVREGLEAERISMPK